MPKTSRHYILLFLIFAFSFSYRMLLMHWETYPPGADIGLHESVIYSITGSGNTNFAYNNYQMGGGLSLTFPGFHIFVSYVMMMTGMPDYLALSTVVSFFSSFIVLCAYLIARVFQGEAAALTVAFLAAISRFDIEMLLWGGFPNVVTLMLMPLAFYLFMQRERFSLLPFLVATTILSGSIFLTHSISAVLFVLITILTAALATIFSRQVGVSRTHALSWVLPLLLGALIVFPFFTEAARAYLTNASQLKVVMSDIQDALLSTRILPLEYVLPSFICIPLFFLFSREYKKRFFSVPSLLLAVWVAVPLLLTQGYIVGFYTDYNRFLYYVILPAVILIAMAIDHGSSFFAEMVDIYLSVKKRVTTAASSSEYTCWLMPSRLRKTFYACFSLVLLVLAFFAVPIFLTPVQGVTIQSFYQTMNRPEYEAIEWARKNTATDSIFVSDALYGWWFSGFAQRSVISAVDPQYLALAREVQPAEFAKNLLDTDYVIDNGLIQVREDGGYIGRHNPMFLTKLNWTYFPYAFLNFNNAETQITYQVNGNPQSIYLDQVPVHEMWIENDSKQATIVVKKGNDFINYTQLVSIYQGLYFVNVSTILESQLEYVSLNRIDFTVHSKGRVIGEIESKTVGLLDEGVKAFSQLIFDKRLPNRVDWDNEESPGIIKIEYYLEKSSKSEIQISVGTYSVTDDLKFYLDKEITEDYFRAIIENNIDSPRKGGNLTITAFDYRAAMKNNAVTHIALRDFDLIPKFVKDPVFGLVFINDYVAIFAVKEARLSGAE